MDIIQQAIDQSDHREDILRMLGFHRDFFDFFPKNYVNIDTDADIVPMMVDVKLSECRSIFKLINFDQNDKVLDYGSGIGLLGILLNDKCSQIDLYEPIDFMKDMVNKIVDEYPNVKIVDDCYEKKYDKIFCRAVIGEFNGIKTHQQLIDLFENFYKMLNKNGCLCFNFHRQDGPSVHHSISQYQPNYIEQIVKQAGFSKFFNSSHTHKTECLAFV